MAPHLEAHRITLHHDLPASTHLQGAGAAMAPHIEAHRITLHYTSRLSLDAVCNSLGRMHSDPWGCIDSMSCMVDQMVL